MQKILIAVDYAPTAQQVAEQGFALGVALKANMVLLHVIEDVSYYPSSSYDPIMGFGGFVNEKFLGDDALKGIEKEAMNYLEKIKIHLGDSTMETIVTHGRIADVILDTIQSLKADMIVIGTKSRNALEEMLLGSTAHKLIKQSGIPMFIIPTKNMKDES